MTIHIGSQSGGVVTNVAGDQRIIGGQHGTYVATTDPAAAVVDLRRALAAVQLDASSRSEAAREVDELAREVGAERPDRERAASALERVTRLLSSAGALAVAGPTLLGPLRALASWAGPAGAAVAALLA